MPNLDETRCRPGAPLKRMITAEEAAIIKRFINGFRVESWNGSAPFIDRSHPYGEYTIYIPRSGGGGAGVDYSKWAFGYSLGFDADTKETTCTISAGTVRIHGQSNLALDESEIVLTGTPCYVYLEYTRPSGGLSLKVINEDPDSTATTVRLPLYIFDGSVTSVPEGDSYLTYSIRTKGGILHLGDFNFDTPIQ